MKREGVMKRFLSLAAIVCGLMLVAVPAMALTVQDLIDSGYSNQDKVFSNFVYTPLDPVHDAAANILATPIFLEPGPGVDQHGFTFTYNSALGLGGSWADGFTLSYTISVGPGFPLVFITSSKDQIFDGQTGPVLPSAVDTQSSGGLLGVLSLNNASDAGQTKSLFYSPVKFVDTSAVVSVGQNGLATWQQNWFETTVGVPEPSILLLLGFGLVGLAGLRRKSN